MLKVKHVMWFFSFLARLLARVETTHVERADKTAAKMDSEYDEHQRRMKSLVAEKEAAEAEAMKAYAARNRLKHILGE